VDWNDLEKAAARYGNDLEAQDRDRHYYRALSRLEWDYPDDTMAANADVFLEFLATYKSYRHTVDKEQLADAWLESVESLSAELEDITLERLDVMADVDRAEDNLFCLGDVIARVYEEVRGIPGMGAANALRLLHLRFPDLFVMADEGVRKYWENSPLPDLFGMSKQRLFEPYGYAFIFLPAMSIHAVDAVMSCSLDEEIDVQEAVDRLRNLDDRERSIARLIDEYCYVLTLPPAPEEPVEAEASGVGDDEEASD